jgi:hypothetical protein
LLSKWVNLYRYAAGCAPCNSSVGECPRRRSALPVGLYKLTAVVDPRA